MGTLKNDCRCAHFEKVIRNFSIMSCHVFHKRENTMYFLFYERIGPFYEWFSEIHRSQGRIDIHIQYFLCSKPIA